IKSASRLASTPAGARGLRTALRATLRVAFLEAVRFALAMPRFYAPKPVCVETADGRQLPAKALGAKTLGPPGLSMSYLPIARLAAQVTALREAVTMFESMPTPHNTRPSAVSASM